MESQEGQKASWAQGQSSQLSVFQGKTFVKFNLSMKFQSGKINFKIMGIVENKEITHTDGHIHPRVLAANTGREGLTHEHTGHHSPPNSPWHADSRGSAGLL